ncbi:hypothetical protein D3C77_571800 [compost metagenome]
MAFLQDVSQFIHAAGADGSQMGPFVGKLLRLLYCAVSDEDAPRLLLQQRIHDPPRRAAAADHKHMLSG